jgi:hypothetical protein
MVCSPSGRPYSPYPYRDLPDTASKWETQATPALLTGAKPSFFDDGREFHRFRYLPAELRLQIWRELVLAACEYGNVHRVRVAIVKSPHTSWDSHHKEPTLELVATPGLADSTFATRALLATCREARQEALSYLGVAPDTLPLQGGGILRCDLTRDVIMLEDLSPTLLLQIHTFHPQTPSLSPIRHLGLDLANPSHLEGFLTRGGIPPQLESALVSFAASFPHLEQIYLLQATATLDTAALTAPEQQQQEDPITVVDWYPTTTAAQGRDHFFPGTAAATDWYTTHPAPSYWVDEAYYLHLARLMRLLCEMRQALDSPPVMTQLEDVEGRLGRLEGVRLRVLRHYAFGEGVGVGEGGLLKLSSPEKCLEVGLGREPRWVQWEWVCQCLDC